MEAIIRKARREDCREIRNLIQELADFEKMPKGPEITSETLEKDGFDSAHPQFICHIAEYKEAVIGFAISYYTYSTWLGKSMYLEDLYVTQQFRGKNIGSKLLKAVAKEAVESNCCRLDFRVLEWNPAKEFYKKMRADNLTVEEGWEHYRMSRTALELLAVSNDLFCIL